MIPFGTPLQFAFLRPTVGWWFSTARRGRAPSLSAAGDAARPPPKQHYPTPTGYRPDIDGLRALALIPVVLFHAGFESFSGGYIGVDVFFVISGYLITSIILNEKEKGTFTLRRFYERRVRRILPALFFVTLACMVPAWLWMTPGQLSDFAQSVAAVSVFGSNILFWQESGYFGAAAEEKPLLHTWSLAVEEQYYVFFPIFLLLLWSLGRRRVAWIIAATALVSLGLSEYVRQYDTDAIFYLAPTRAWELLIGALVAFSSSGRPLHDRVGKTFHEAMAGLGLLMVLSPVFLYDRNTPFPGTYALLPTLGTALIIVFGSSNTVVARFLSLRAIVGLGLISYSAYLWHQPLFAFARIRSLDGPSPSLLAALSVAAVVLAYFSWRYVEKPFRDRRNFSRTQMFCFAGVISGGLVAVGAIGHLANGFVSRVNFPAGLINSFESTAREEECFDIDNGHSRATGWYCLVDVTSHAKPTFLVIGDSHALSLLPAFETAARLSGKNGVFTGFAGCPPLLGIVPLTRRDQTLRNCSALNERVFSFVKENGITDVFVVARWTYYTNGDYSGDTKVIKFIGATKNAEASLPATRKAFEDGFARTVAAYDSAGVRLHVVEQAPHQLYEPQALYSHAYMSPSKAEEVVRKLSVPHRRHTDLQSFVDSVFEKYRKDSRVSFIDLDSLLCDEHICLMGTGAQSFYKDDDHLSKVGANLALADIFKHLE